jgi:hypothetical protein
MSIAPTRRRLVTGQVYTYAEINAIASDPSLRFRIGTWAHPLQDAHVHSADIMEADPAWASARFRFDGETSERIELFTFIGTDAERDALIAYEPDIDLPGALWLTPRNHPREQ